MYYSDRRDRNQFRFDASCRTCRRAYASSYYQLTLPALVFFAGFFFFFFTAAHYVGKIGLFFMHHSLLSKRVRGK